MLSTATKPASNGQTNYAQPSIILGRERIAKAKESENTANSVDLDNHIAVVPLQ
jgi:hypothetical protein